MRGRGRGGEGGTRAGCGALDEGEDGGGDGGCLVQGRALRARSPGQSVADAVRDMNKSRGGTAQHCSTWIPETGGTAKASYTSHRSHIPHIKRSGMLSLHVGPYVEGVCGLPRGLVVQVRNY